MRIFHIFHRFRRRSAQEPNGTSITEDAIIIQNDEIKPSALDNILPWIFTVSVFLLPIFFVFFSGVLVEIQKTIFITGFVVLAFLIWVIARLRNGVFVVPKHPLLVAGLFLVIVSLASTIFSPAFKISFSGFVYENGTFVSMIILFSALFLSSIVFQTPKRVYYLYAALFTSFLFLFVFHILRLFLGVDFLSFGIFQTIIASTFGKWNDVGVFSGLLVLLSFFALEFTTLTGRNKFLTYVVFVASLIMMALVNFFIIWIVVGIGALSVFVYNLFVKQFFGKTTGGKRFSVLSIVIIILSVVFLVFGAQIGVLITDYVGLNHLEVRPSWSSTLSIVGETWKEDLLLGTGPGRFENQWLAFKPEGINDTAFWNTNFSSGIGLLPTFAITSGLLGVLAWLLFLSLFLYSFYRSLFISLESSVRYFLVSSGIAALYIWVISIFYVPNYFLFYLGFLMTGIFIGLSVYVGSKNNKTIRVTRDPRIGFVMVLILIVVLIGAVFSGYTLFGKFLSLKFLNDGRIAFNEEGNIDEARDAFEKSVRFNNHDSLYRLLVDVEIVKINTLLTSQDDPIETLRQEFQETLGRAIEAAQTAVNLNRTNYSNWLSLGRVYSSVVPLSIPGAYENARSSFSEVRKLNPLSPEIRFREAELEIANGNIEQAREYINQSLSLRSSYTEAIFFLARLEISAGNVKAAIESLDRVSLLNPNDAGLFFQLGLLKYNEDDYAGAVESLERAVGLSPNYSNAKYFLGLSYDAQGRKEEALDQFISIRELNPDNVEIPLIIKNLESGERALASIVPTDDISDSETKPPIDE